jgi:hypothetical protein
MLNGMSRIIERNIKKAIDQGSFNDLPGKGKAQQLADMRFIPPEQRAIFWVLRNSGTLPPEMELRKEITNLEEQLQIATEQDKLGIIKAITEENVL